MLEIVLITLLMLKGHGWQHIDMTVVYCVGDCALFSLQKLAEIVTEIISTLRQIFLLYCNFIDMICKVLISQ